MARPAGPSTPSVLCYHRVGGPLELGVTRVARRVFARHVITLARSGWRTLTLAQYASRIGGTPAADGERECLLTFDDGYASLADFAYPLLRDLGFMATTFVVTDFVGQANTWDVRYTWRRMMHLDWRAMEQWQARGFAFASHTASHARLTWLSDARVTNELARSRDALVRRLGAEAGRALAYPFAAYDPRIERLAGSLGYELGFGGVRGTGSPLGLPRVPVYVWDVGSVPLGLRTDMWGQAGRLVARVANRCAIGTSVIRGVTRGN